MNVIKMPQLIMKWVQPLVIMVDLQKEYVSEGRAYYLETAQPAVENCRLLLSRARRLRLPVGHFRQVQQGHFFNGASSFARWIDGFEPHGSEYVFDRSQPSCFGSPAFCELIENIQRPEIIIAGLGGDNACLATAIDGFHRNVRVTFISDCSTSAAIGQHSETASHDFIKALAGHYCEVLSVDQILGRLEVCANQMGWH